MLTFIFKDPPSAELPRPRPLSKKEGALPVATVLLLPRWKSFPLSKSAVTSFFIKLFVRDVLFAKIGCRNVILSFSFAESGAAPGTGCCHLRILVVGDLVTRLSAFFAAPKQRKSKLVP